ncbi:hypothetical protein CMI47_11290 [Candidatus Pacearchaeota archaeon]|nr:hypothetical protein [Candidatus Pacearchaeota archaeon]|tara:strand:- start:3488 stop:4129 length:642 start_codon:yes stop_codon:yes gene_type:complete
MIQQTNTIRRKAQLLGGKTHYVHYDQSYGAKLRVVFPDPDSLAEMTSYLYRNSSLIHLPLWDDTNTLDIRVTRKAPQAMCEADVLAAAMEAYADCHGLFPDGDQVRENEAYKHRNLWFRANLPVGRTAAKAIMAQVLQYTLADGTSDCPPGYNEFEPDLIDRFPEDTQFLIAREGSVCLYVKSRKKLPTMAVVRCDEMKQYDGDDGYTRYWWD